MRTPIAWLLPLLAAAFACLGGTAAATAALSPGRTRLEPFDYRGVTLDGGRLRAQYDRVREIYLGIPNDGLLKGFRERAGRAAPGPALGGWYSADTFHVFGQILSGLARFYAGSGDAACRDKAAFLIHEWAECIAPDGFFYYSEHPNARHYVFDKMVAGLLDNYLYCGNEEALSCLSRITDWAVGNLNRNHHGWNMEWYTLSENLYRAYLATGDAKYRDFARVWEYPEYWDLYAEKRDLFSVPPRGGERAVAFHAYSHVNTLSGAAAAYLVTGEKRYLETLLNAYEYLQATQTFATGGYGPGEMLLPRPAVAASLADPFQFKHFETQCGSWAAFKLAKYLIRFTGDARYGDWVERLVYNGIGASLPMSADGNVMYESDYHLGGAKKRNTTQPWTCCAGTRPSAIADYVDLIYFRDDNNLYVNLFLPSTVQWSHRDTMITLRQRTAFPESDAVELSVSTSKPSRFGLRVRAPEWLAGPLVATLNGRRVRLQMLKTGWAALERKWRDGDRLRLLLPMQLRASRIDPPRPHPAAILYGPVVLAVGSRGANPGDKIDVENPGRSLLAIEGRPLHFRLAAAPSLLARPFYEFEEGERYFLYFDPAWSHRISPRDFRFEGKWMGSVTREIGASAECTFEGTGIRWLGQRFDDAGRAEVAIDGRVIAVVDQFGPGRNLPFSWEQRCLAPGEHTLRITLLAEKDPRSRDHFLNITGLEILVPGKDT
jgi:hypothetical protein